MILLANFNKQMFCGEILRVGSMRLLAAWQGALNYFLYPKKEREQFLKLWQIILCTL